VPSKRPTRSVAASAPTLSDVARRAGVSTSVVSRVLNRDPAARISAETAEKVRAAAADLRYVPNDQARAFRRARSGAIALVVPHVGNAVFAELFSGVQAAASGRETKVLLAEVSGPVEASSDLVEIIGHGRVDGVILQRREDVDDHLLRTIVDVPQPVVLFNSALSRRPGSVTLPDQLATAIATEHLMSLGHTRIGYVGGSDVHDAARRRANGFRGAFKAAGKRVDRSLMVAAGWEADAGVAAAREILGRPRPPTGIVVASINAAIGVVSEIAHRGLRVPDDVSVVTVQETWVADMFVPPLTRVAMPMREAGEVAAHMLLDHLDGKPASDVTVTTPPPSLVVRSSTTAPTGSVFR
jgi:LacI family transcriptional regulator